MIQPTPAEESGDIRMSDQSIAALLAEPVGSRIHVGDEWSGFGGLHGGLSLALLTSAMSQLVPDLCLRSVTAQYLRAVRGETEVEVWASRRGRTLSATEATAGKAHTSCVRASALWGRGQQTDRLPFAPDAPPAPPPEELDVVVIPPGMVPFGRQVEVRPVGTARPFAAGLVPELTAWIRFVSDDQPPDVLRLITLMDALPPSYAAVLAEPGAVPTIEFTVRPAAGLAGSSSPWVLVRASTNSATSDGWVDEEIHAWGPDGNHLASAWQLRVVL
jgi:hypothetical protein